MLTLYHNPKCRKSREALNYLEEQKVSYTVVLYFDHPFITLTLQEVLKKIGLPPSAIFRKNEAEWKALANRNILKEKEILSVMVKHPKLIERPIVVDEKSGVLARPIENLIQFLNAH